MSRKYVYRCVATKRDWDPSVQRFTNTRLEAGAFLRREEAQEQLKSWREAHHQYLLDAVIIPERAVDLEEDGDSDE